VVLTSERKRKYHQFEKRSYSATFKHGGVRGLMHVCPFCRTENHFIRIEKLDLCFCGNCRKEVDNPVPKV